MSTQLCHFNQIKSDSLAFVFYLENTSPNNTNEILDSYQISGSSDLIHELKADYNQSIESFSNHTCVKKVCFVKIKQNKENQYLHDIMTNIIAAIQYPYSNMIVDVRLIEHYIDNNNPILHDIGLGIVKGRYSIGPLKSDYKVKKEASVQIISNTTKPEYLISFSKGGELARTVRSVMDLLNAPANKKTPIEMAEWAVKSANTYDYSVNILEKKELQELGMHAILAVNRGSEVDAKCILGEYRHPNAQKHIVIVGKGITFDTGGISLKSPANMHYMKSDMGGAVATLGTIEAVAKRELEINLSIIVPTTDNSIGTLAFKPSDVIDSYSGKTIEIIDTDAEGRLVLADGLSYAVKNLKPDYLVDLATLTGSAVRALGTHASAMMSHNDELAYDLYQAGQRTGEKVWRMPLWEEYHEYMKSDVADIKNLSDKPLAGCITAAKFLEFFTEKHPAWVHFDIAAMAFKNTPLAKAYNATGFGVYLLVNWIEHLIENQK